MADIEKLTGAEWDATAQEIADYIKGEGD